GDEIEAPYKASQIQNIALPEDNVPEPRFSRLVLTVNEAGTAEIHRHDLRIGKNPCQFDRFLARAAARDQNIDRLAAQESFGLFILDRFGEAAPARVRKFLVLLPDFLRNAVVDGSDGFDIASGGIRIPAR